MDRDALTHILMFVRKPERAILYLLLLIYGLILLFTFPDYGITTDEEGHVRYGESVVRWYTSGFRDRQVFGWTNLWLYGGAYDGPVYLLTQISPLDLYDTRHLVNALTGLLGVIGVSRLGRLCGLPRAGVLAALFLILTPRYYGHCFNNPKDIPFAVGYLWSVYFLIRGLGRFPALSWKDRIQTGLALGLTMGIRIGGVILPAYLCAFYLLRGFQIARQKATHRDRRTLVQFLKQTPLQLAPIGLLAFGVMLLFWPWAQLDPLHRPIQALTYFSHFPIAFHNFYDGRYIPSTHNPWHYPLRWLALTLPEFILVGLLAGSVCLVCHLARRKARTTGPEPLQFGLLLCSALFPVVYTVVLRPPIYDALRHLLFVLPPLAVLSALGAAAALNRLRGRWRWGLYALLCLLLSAALWDLYALHPNQYLYFNRLIAGGLARAATRYPTDYWDNSYKQGIRWIEAHAQPPENRKQRIASAASGARHLLDTTRYEYTHAIWDADLYLSTTREDRHRVLPGDIRHIVRAAGVPILYIIRPDSARRTDPFFAPSGLLPFRDLHLAGRYEAAEMWEQAVAAYRKALEKAPEHAHAHTRLAELYLHLGQHGNALEHAQKALRFGPGDARARVILGDCHLYLEQPRPAIDAYREALRIQPDMSRAWHNLGNAFTLAGRHAEAARAYERALEIDPEFTPALKSLGQAFYDLGELDKARGAFTRALEAAPSDPEAHHKLALILDRQGRPDSALEHGLRGVETDPRNADAHLHVANLFYRRGQRENAQNHYRQVIRLRPDDAAAHQNLGATLAEQGHLEAALEPLRAAVRLDSTRAEAWYMLAQVHRLTGDPDRAHAAIEKALARDPERAEYRRELLAIAAQFQARGRADGAIDQTLQTSPQNEK